MDQQDGLKFYHPARVIEDIQMLPEFIPIRVFAVLFPLWSIETTATQKEGRPYDLLEEYVERGIEQGDLHTSKELANFFGLETRLVDKVLMFLETTGHIECITKRWFLTDLGKSSLQSNTRYVAKSASYRLYFDGFRSRPLLREHYGKGLQVFSHLEAAVITQRSRGGYQFLRLVSMEQWDPVAIRRLEMQSDRRNYNLPPEAYNLHASDPVQVYMPMYIVEAEKQVGRFSTSYYVTYTHIKGRRDNFFEEMVNTYQEVKRALQAEKSLDVITFWREWLISQGVTPVPPIQRNVNNVWQVILPKEIFYSPQATLTLEDVGIFRLERGYILRLWCNDPFTRRKAALDRALRITERMQIYITRRDITERLQRFAELLDTDELTFEDLRKRADERNLKELIEVIDSL